MVLMVENKALKKKSCKKVLEIFGGLKKMTYFCTTFALENELRDFKWFFDLLVI